MRHSLDRKVSVKMQECLGNIEMRRMKKKSWARRSSSKLKRQLLPVRLSTRRRRHIFSFCFASYFIVFFFFFYRVQVAGDCFQEDCWCPSVGRVAETRWKRFPIPRTGIRAIFRFSPVEKYVSFELKFVYGSCPPSIQQVSIIWHLIYQQEQYKCWKSVRKQLDGLRDSSTSGGRRVSFRIR